MCGRPARRPAVCVRGRGLFSLSFRFAAAVVMLVCSGPGWAQRYGYNDRGVALHWNEISSAPAWDAYPVEPARPTSLDELYRQGVKMLRVRVRGLQHATPEQDAPRFVSSEGVAMESSLALARSTAETTETWARARPCGETCQKSTAATLAAVACRTCVFVFRIWIFVAPVDLMQRQSGIPAGEIDFLLRSCLDASQTDGVPNSSRCYWAPTPEEAVACWCRVCDFQRAIEICSVPSLFQKCDACQMGRSLQDWTQSQCAAGGALSVRVNMLKGRIGVSEERWHGDVREVAQSRLEAQALLLLHRSDWSWWARIQVIASALLLLAVLVSSVSLAIGMPSTTVLSTWVSVAKGLLVVTCKLLEGLVCLVCYVTHRSPPGALMALLQPPAAARSSGPSEKGDGFFSAASSMNNSPQKARRSGQARASSAEDSDAAAGERRADGGGDGEGEGEGEGFLSAPASPSKFSRTEVEKALRRKALAAGKASVSPRTQSASDDEGEAEEGPEPAVDTCLTTPSTVPHTPREGASSAKSKGMGSRRASRGSFNGGTPLGMGWLEEALNGGAEGVGGGGRTRSRPSTPMSRLQVRRRVKLSMKKRENAY